MKGRFQHRQGRGTICGGGFRPSGLIALSAVAVTLAASAAFAGVPAVNFWFDDFNDGNATDGSPLTWTPHPFTPGTYDASSGDYELTPPTPGDQDETMVTAVLPANNPGVSTFTDMSIRTRGVLTASEGNILIGGRFDFNTISGYVINIDHGGLLQVLGAQGGEVTELVAEYDPPDDGPNFIDSLTDVVVQFDVFGSTLSATFWRPGDPQPEPFLVGVSNTFASGDGSLVYNEDSPDETDTSSGIYRWAKALQQKLIDGDMDLDGDVDFDDIDDFVQGLNSPGGYETEKGVPPVMMGDTDNDGDQDFDDIGVFVTILSGSASAGANVPEPSSAMLAVLGVMGLLVVARRRR